MAFNNTIRQLTTDDTNHASNFNDIHNKLLENDLFLNNSKVDKSQIKNTLTEAQEGFVLDARQGKKLNDEKLDKLKGLAAGTSCDSVLTVGMYQCSSWTQTPSGLPDGQGMLIVIPYGTSTGWVRQIFVSPHSNTWYSRARINNTFYSWASILESYVMLWNGAITLSDTSQSITLSRSMATAKKIRVTFNSGASVTSAYIHPVNSENTIRVGGNWYYIPIQAGTILGYIRMNFATETSCNVIGSSSWVLSHISGVF